MGKKSSVYDELLTGYLAILEEQRTVEDRAKAGIEDAQASIEKNTDKMSKAVAAGDQDAYVQLSSENDRLKGTIAFFKEVLKKSKAEQQASATEKADILLKKADVEINRIKSEYVKELCEALQPVIQKSNDVLCQVELLELAKNRLLLNIKHEPEHFRIQFNYNDISMMRGLNQMLQSPDCITEMCGKGVKDTSTLSAIIAAGNKWDKPARSRFNEEAAKWIY